MKAQQEEENKMQVAKDETSLAVYFAIVNEYGHKKEKIELAE